MSAPDLRIVPHGTTHPLAHCTHVGQGMVRVLTVDDEVVCSSSLLQKSVAVTVESMVEHPHILEAVELDHEALCLSATVCVCARCNFFFEHASCLPLILFASFSHPFCLPGRIMPTWHTSCKRPTTCSRPPRSWTRC